MDPEDAPLVIREFDQTVAADVQAFVAPEIAGSRYPSGPRASLDALIGKTDPDCRAHVALRGDTVAGVVIHGAIAGTLGAGRLQLIVTAPRFRRTGVARALVGASLEALRSLRARAAFVEMPDDPVLAPSTALHQPCGFHYEARVPDFYRDGVDLIVLRRDLRAD